MSRTGEHVKLRAPDPNSFQVLFGRLVRKYREKAGLKQMDVARLVYRDEEATSRVSDLERGRHCPQADTIASFREALGISEAEVEACKQQHASQLSGTFRAELGLAEGLLENLALRFGHDDPTGGRAQLMEYLREKAREYRLLKEGIVALAHTEQRASNQILAARVAIEAGDFAEADKLLKFVEEIHQSDRTLVEIRKQAAVRELRGDAALLGGDALAAYSHFAAVADFFEPFSPLDATEHRRRLAERLVEQAKQFAGDWLNYAAALIQRNETFYSSSGDTRNLARTKATMGSYLGSSAERTGSQTTFDQAAKALNDALALLKTRKNSWDWFAAQLNLAAVFRGQGVRDLTDAGPISLISAEEILNMLLERRPRDKFTREWAFVKLDLGRLLAERSRREPSAEAIDYLQRALESIEASQTAFADEQVLDRWVESGCARATTLLRLAEIKPEIERPRLVLLAAEQFEQASKAVSPESEPLWWADIQIRLALLYGEHADDYQLFCRSIQAIESSLKIYTYDQHPTQWLDSQSILLWLHFKAVIKAETGSRRKELTKIIDVIQKALKFVTFERDPDFWLLAKFSLGLTTAAQGLLAEKKAVSRLLGSALKEFAALLRTSDDDLGFLRLPRQLGDQANDFLDLEIEIVKFLEFSAETLRDLRCSTSEQKSLGWAVVATLEGSIAEFKGERARGLDGSKFFIEAIALYDESLDIFDRAQHQISSSVRTARNRAAAALNAMGPSA